LGVFRVKNHDFTPKNHIFSNCGGDDECLMHLEKNIQRIRQNNNSQVWLGGDFNLGGIEWHNYSSKVRHRT
jgi:hypothetical protein